MTNRRGNITCIFFSSIPKRGFTNTIFLSDKGMVRRSWNSTAIMSLEWVNLIEQRYTRQPSQQRFCLHLFRGRFPGQASARNDCRDAHGQRVHLSRKWPITQQHPQSAPVHRGLDGFVHQGERVRGVSTSASWETKKNTKVGQSLFWDVQEFIWKRHEINN